MQSSRVFRADLLKDQTVIVTGGGSGIGRAIAFEAGRLGARVAIGARKPERLNETLDALRAEGITAWAHPLDIREPEQCEAFERGVTEHLGSPDALVNNAGGQFPSPAADIRVKGWRAVVDTNLNGTWFMTQAVGRGMIERQRGRVVNIVANMWRGFPGMAHTGAARAARPFTNARHARTTAAGSPLRAARRSRAPGPQAVRPAPRPRTRVRPR